MAVGAVVHGQATRVFLAETQSRAEGTLQLATTALEGYLERFDRLPPLLARQEAIHDLLARPDDPEVIDAANRFLQEVTGVLGASDIYVMDATGLTRAASNFDQPHSFVGGNFAFRPYFSDAVSSGAGRFYALGTTSLKRGFYFGAPVLEGDRVRGVVAIKIDVDSVESAWMGTDYHVVVTDPQGVVFLASNPDWRFGRTLSMTPEGQSMLAATRRYADATLFDIPLERDSTVGGPTLWRIGAEGQDSREYLLADVAMPDADWTLKVLQSTAPARTQALIVTAGSRSGAGASGDGRGGRAAAPGPAARPAGVAGRRATAPRSAGRGTHPRTGRGQPGAGGRGRRTAPGRGQPAPGAGRPGTGGQAGRAGADVGGPRA
jgi:two-component system, NtrC family, C4-dicarboxylate transport sensor histidine kinase DctB